ncbi:MAG TPA: hypothetical protein VEO53_15285, partial [Candidatus Binatia bacterium]|nr:hypothetical protein [Candidatus Binatia bacterium]
RSSQAKEQENQLREEKYLPRWVACQTPVPVLETISKAVISLPRRAQLGANEPRPIGFPILS